MSSTIVGGSNPKQPKDSNHFTSWTPTQARSSRVDQDITVQMSNEKQFNPLKIVPKNGFSQQHRSSDISPMLGTCSIGNMLITMFNVQCSLLGSANKVPCLDGPSLSTMVSSTSTSESASPPAWSSGRFSGSASPLLLAKEASCCCSASGHRSEPQGRSSA